MSHFIVWKFVHSSPISSTMFPMLTSCGSSNCRYTLYNLILLIPLCMLNSFKKFTRLCNKWKHPIEMKHLNETCLIVHKRFFQNTKCIFIYRITFWNVCWTIVQGSNDFLLFWKGPLSDKSKGRFCHPKCMEETHVVNLFQYQKPHCIVISYAN